MSDEPITKFATLHRARSGTDVRQFLAGEWVGGGDGTFPVIDPSTEQPIASVARAGRGDVAAAVDAAAAAQPAWAATPPRERAEMLRRAFDLMTRASEELALLIATEMGKPLRDARGEVAYAADFLRWYAEEAVRIGGTFRTSPHGGNKILTYARPVGVALLLTPWNFPAAMVTRKVAPALAAGCAAIVKPAEDTPLTALAIAQLFTEAGLPAGVLSVLTTDRPAELVEAALADDRVRKLSFTGSTRVGARLLKQAADRVLNCSMELGGNDPFIVLEDADLDAAVAGAMIAKTRSGGQACTAANRFLVHESIADDFAARLADAMSGLRVGSPRAEETELGPMINARAVDGIADKVERSVDAGAKVRLGGSPLDGPGYYYAPTVLSDVPPDCATATEEIFGPVAPVISVRDDSEAVRLANATDMGLAAYVYSGSLGRALSLAEQLESGMIAINRGALSDAAAPFGGVKQSGLGREGGSEGILAYLETVYLALSY